MASFCSVIIVGNLCSDVEMRYTPSGAAVGNVNIAVNRKWNTESGEVREDVAFIPCTLWNKAAETVAQYVKKGSPILFQGYLRQENWDDKQTGQKRSKLVLVVNQFQFIGSRLDGEQGERRESERGQRNRPPAEAADESQPPGDDTDVPF